MPSNLSTPPPAPCRASDANQICDLMHLADEFAETRAAIVRAAYTDPRMDSPPMVAAIKASVLAREALLAAVRGFRQREEPDPVPMTPTLKPITARCRTDWAPDQTPDGASPACPETCECGERCFKAYPAAYGPRTAEAVAERIDAGNANAPIKPDAFGTVSISVTRKLPGPNGCEGYTGCRGVTTRGNLCIDCYSAVTDDGQGSERSEQPERFDEFTGPSGDRSHPSPPRRLPMPDHGAEQGGRGVSTRAGGRDYRRGE